MGMHYFTDEQVKELEKNPNQIFLTDIAYLGSVDKQNNR
jgi:hypothetical protein